MGCDSIEYQTLLDMRINKFLGLQPPSKQTGDEQPSSESGMIE